MALGTLPTVSPAARNPLTMIFYTQTLCINYRKDIKVRIFWFSGDRNNEMRFYGAIGTIIIGIIIYTLPVACQIYTSATKACFYLNYQILL